MKKVFLAGIIQGSLPATICDQDYRRLIKDIMMRHLPDVQVYCPVAAHPNSIAYDDMQARDVFMSHVELACRSDLVVAYLPLASMGTAIELWESHRCGTPTLAITPMEKNWVIRFLCDLVVADLAEFEQACADGRVGKLLHGEGSLRARSRQ